LPGATPQYVYPIANQQAPVMMPVPVNNPGGFTVQVTTQVGIPGQAGFPGMAGPGQVPVGQMMYPGYPVMQGAAPGAVPTQGGFGPVYPGAGWNAWPTTPSLPATNGGWAEAIANPALLPLAAQTTWQQIIASPNQANSQTIAALQQLIREYPNFTPAYIQLAQGLINSNRTQEAVAILERGTTLYPNQPELARSLIIALGNSNRWNEAAMAARQFAIRNPNSSVVSEFSKLADESSQLAQARNSNTIRPARNTMLGGLLTAGLGYLLTGRVASPITSSATPWTGITTNPVTANNQMTQEFLNRVQLLNDGEVANYVNEIGRKLSQAAGRNNFEFYVVRDRDTGAIALPDGKIFVSAGSILNTNSEAELASLIARQMGHSLLSHPDQIARRTNMTTTLTRLLPAIGGLVNPRVREFNNSTTGTLVSGLMGSLANGLFRPNYNAQMVNQANTTATKLLETAGYSQGTLVSLGNSDRHAQMKTRTQQLLGVASQPWWAR
jgi:predicted Zn-dependent protease